MNNKLLKVSVMLILVFSIILVPFAVEASPIKLNYSIFLPPNHPQTIIAINWSKEVEEQSEGKVKIDIFPGNSLIRPRDCYDGVISGIVDIGFSSFAYTPGRFPIVGALELPIGLPNGIVASSVANQFVKELRPKELNDVKVLYLHASGPTYLHTSKPIRNIENIKGLKLRSSYQSSQIISALGASPLKFPMAEAYTSLQKGAVDGLFAPKWSLTLWRLAEVIQYTTDTSVIGDTTTMFVVMNKPKWNSLSPNLQKLFEGRSDFWVKKHGEAWDKLADEAVKYSAKLNHQFIELPENEVLRLQKIVQPIFEKYKQEVPNGIEYIRKIEDLIIKTSSRKCPRGYYDCNTNKCCKKK